MKNLKLYNDLEKLYCYKYRNYPFHLPCVVYYIVRSFRRLATQIENVNKIVAAVLMQYNSMYFRIYPRHTI